MADIEAPIYLLAMDHRASLAKDVYGLSGPVSETDARRIADGKELVYAALDPGADGVGVLVDERYGASVARAARAAGILLAMPIEKSGEALFTPEYGEDWPRHVDSFNPDLVKVLVRDNPGFAAADRSAQFRALAAVSARLRAAARPLLFELLVPPTDDQRGDRYDADVRPALTVQVIADMYDAGVEPDIWKVEGLETRQAAEKVVAAARAGGHDRVRCVVLGRDAPRDRLDHWLTVAAGVDGFVGFAIGRSIWEQPLEHHLAGDLDRDAAIAAIAANYRHFRDVYGSAPGPR